MDEEFLYLLEALRVVYGKAIIPSSGYRCSRRNSVVSRTGSHGPHTKGEAIDIKIAGEEAFRLLRIIMNMPFTGIGINQKGDWGSRFIHIDTLKEGRPITWSY